MEREPSEDELEYFRPDEFDKALANQTCIVNNRNQKVSRLWFNHPERCEYPFGTICDPTGNVDARYFNTWRGFAVSANDEDPSAMVEHIDAVIADGGYCQLNENSGRFRQITPSCGTANQ